MHIDKALSHCLSEAGEYALPSTLSCSLANVNRHTQSTKEISLDCLALVTKRTGIPELQETVTIGKIVFGGPQNPGHREKTEYTTSLPVKKAF